MHRRDKTSNVPSRRGVQPNVEISSRSEKTETAATSWTSATKKHENSVGSDNPTHLGSDYPGKEAGLSDALKCLVGF